MTNMDQKDAHHFKSLTSRNKDFSQWYLDVIDAAQLAEYSSVRGCMVIKPYGYAIWELTRNILDEKFKATGVQNAYFPLLIPEKLLKKEAEHVKGFSPQVAAVTYAGGKRLKEALIIRPTSETIIYETFSKWIHSHRDLPILINQWVNVVRWEMRPRLFLRTTEFLWQEGHTVHSNSKEADERARLMLKIYKDFVEKYLAIPVMEGLKSETEKFAGALSTYTLEAMMQDGKALQMATSHNLGQKFAKVFGLEFTDKDGVSQYCWQTSWGLSTRIIGALIMVHGDDKGLVLPPKIAPIQVVIIPIGLDSKNKLQVSKTSQSLFKNLLKEAIKAELDLRDYLSVGEKFYEWEKRGVPIRIEIGPKDVASKSVILVRRDTNGKASVSLSGLPKTIKKTLEEIQSNLYSRAFDYKQTKTKTVNKWEDFIKEIDGGNFVFAYWCGDKTVEAKIQKETGATIRCLPLNLKTEEGKCIYSGKKSNLKVLFAKAY